MTDEVMKSYSEMTKAEKYHVLGAMQSVLENKFGEMTVTIPTLCNGPVDFSVSAILAMVQHERRMLRCEGRPNAR